MKILILKPSSLGDVVQALPVLRLLRQHFATAEIYWWIDARWQDLLEKDPNLTGRFTFGRKEWYRPLRWADWGASLREMRDLRLDWVIDLQALLRSALVAWLARGAYTIGLQDFREGAPAFYDASVPRSLTRPHAVDWYLDVLRYLGVPADRPFTWLYPFPEAAASIDRKWHPAGRRWIGIHPGARWWNKKWPADHFAELLGRLGRRHPDLHFVVFGGREEQPLGERLVRELGGRGLNLAGQTSLKELVEWIRHCQVVVSNDSGPMHLAAALNRPLVALFGPTNPRRTGPYGQPSAALQQSLSCVPCMRAHCHYIEPLACLRGLSPERVMKQVEKELAKADADHEPNSVLPLVTEEKAFKVTL